jgi:signal transduction histidine kinase
MELKSKMWIWIVWMTIIGFVGFCGDTITSLVPFLSKEILFVLYVALCVLLIVMISKRENEMENIQYQFLSIATHKFRTPLTAIKWSAEELKKEKTRNEVFELAKTIDISISKISEAVNILTGLVRSHSSLKYAFKPVWIRNMIDVTLERYSSQIKQKNINFYIKSDPEIPIVEIDEQKIQFVIDTLFDNAVLYSPKDSKIVVNLYKKDKHIIISFEDWGIGIDKKDMPFIFNRFWRSEEAKKIDTEGMGISLSMAYEIMKRHGGKIWAESEGLNQGSKFFIKFRIPRKLNNK